MNIYLAFLQVSKFYKDDAHCVLFLGAKVNKNKYWVQKQNLEIVIKNLRVFICPYWRTNASTINNDQEPVWVRLSRAGWNRSGSPASGADGGSGTSLRYTITITIIVH